MKKLILFKLLFLFAIHASGQLQGTVTDSETGEILIGATISVDDTSYGTISGTDGYYTMDLPDGSYTITIRYVGYTDFTQSLTVNGLTMFDVRLVSGVVLGDDIVISATKRAEKRTLSPATIETITAREIDNYAGNASELLSRQKGIDYFRAGIAGPAFNVRGFNSNFNSKNLQVTDGRFSTLIATGLPLGALDPVIQDDIERVEVILGPNSTM